MSNLSKISAILLLVQIISYGQSPILKQSIGLSGTNGSASKSLVYSNPDQWLKTISINYTRNLSRRVEAGFAFNVELNPTKKIFKQKIDKTVDELIYEDATYFFLIPISSASQPSKSRYESSDISIRSYLSSDWLIKFSIQESKRLKLNTGLELGRLNYTLSEEKFIGSIVHDHSSHFDLLFPLIFSSTDVYHAKGTIKQSIKNSHSAVSKFILGLSYEYKIKDMPIAFGIGTQARFGLGLKKEIKNLFSQTSFQTNFQISYLF